MESITSLQDRKRQTELAVMDRAAIEAGCKFIESAVIKSASTSAAETGSVPPVALEINEHVTAIRRLLEGRAPDRT